MGGAGCCDDKAFGAPCASCGFDDAGDHGVAEMTPAPPDCPACSGSVPADSPSMHALSFAVTSSMSSSLAGDPMQTALGARDLFVHSGPTDDPSFPHVLDYVNATIAMGAAGPPSSLAFSDPAGEGGGSGLNRFSGLGGPGGGQVGGEPPKDPYKPGKKCCIEAFEFPVAPQTRLKLAKTAKERQRQEHLRFWYFGLYARFTDGSKATKSADRDCDCDCCVIHVWVTSRITYTKTSKTSTRSTPPDAIVDWPTEDCHWILQGYKNPGNKKKTEGAAGRYARTGNHRPPANVARDKSGKPIRQCPGGKKEYVPDARKQWKIGKGVCEYAYYDAHLYPLPWGHKTTVRESFIAQIWDKCPSLKLKRWKAFVIHEDTTIGSDGTVEQTDVATYVTGDSEKGRMRKIAVSPLRFRILSGVGGDDRVKALGPATAFTRDSILREFIKAGKESSGR